MVATHFRWDFIGLSTDTKPTPATSNKVVNGSTFYCSDNSKLYVWYKTQWYEKTATGGASYTAGTGIDITNNAISVDTTTIQPKLTAGSNVTISDDTISATDTTYSDFTGTDGTSAGSSGLVPAPATTDAGKFLKADGTWDTAGGGGVTPVQTAGSSTTDVMSQDATSKLVYKDYTNYPEIINIGTTNEQTVYPNVCIGARSKGGSRCVAIGAVDAMYSSYATTASGETSVALGSFSKASGKQALAICSDSEASGENSVAIGAYAKATAKGQFDISASNSSSQTKGYNSTPYRLLTGLYDGQSAHDAVTVEQVNGVIDAINTALSTNIPHIGASV